MPKNYTDVLAEWITRREVSRPRQDKNLVAFLAVLADVKTAREAGYAIKTIWEHLHETGKIPYRYETFLKHVRRHIKPAPTETPKQVGSATARTETHPMKSKEPDPAASIPKKTPPPSVSGFTFNATPKKEDLL